jgi:hypothetical protein
MSGVAATSNNETSTTRSGVGAATIVITNDTAQQAATGQSAEAVLAGLNRNTVTGTDTSDRLGNSLDVQAVRADLEITSAFGSSVGTMLAAKAAQTVGDIGEAHRKEAEAAERDYTRLADQAASNGDASEAARYSALALEQKNTAAAWGDNGVNRIALHAGAQGLIGGLAGGSAGAISSISGVAGGNLGQQLGEYLGTERANALGLTDSDRAALINSYQEDMAKVGGMIVGKGGSVLGGATGLTVFAGTLQGGATATTVDSYNRQLHLAEIALAKKYAKQVAKQGGITEEEAIARIERQLLRWVNADTFRNDGGRVDELVVSTIGITGADKSLGIAWNYKNFGENFPAEYNNSLINSNNINSYSPLLASQKVGKTPAQYEHQAYDGTVAALTAASCGFSFGAGCLIMNGFNIGDGAVKIGNGENVGGAIQIGAGVLGLRAGGYGATKSTSAISNESASTGSAIKFLGVTNERELSTLSGINSGAYTTNAGTNAIGYSGLTTVDSSGRLIPGGIPSNTRALPISNTTLANPGTKISVEMEAKILYGERVTNSEGVLSNKIIGAHSGEISNASEKYAVQVLSLNDDGTRNVKLVLQFPDGEVSRIKASTLFPDSWTDMQTINAIKIVGGTQPVAVRASDGAALYQSTVNGVKIEVIKVGSIVTAGYPAGTKGFQMPSVFVGVKK